MPELKYLLSFRRLFEIAAVDIVVPDLQKAGGPREGQRIANLANLYYTPFATHIVASLSRGRGLCPCVCICSKLFNFITAILFSH